MASIVSSQIVSRSVQVDGRVYTLERHIDDSGNVYDFNYLGPADTDVNAIMAHRATDLAAQLNAPQDVNE